MGYEINSPVKTVYLPVFGESMLSNQYKEKTGIDLYDIFDVDEEASEVRLKPYTNVILYFNDDKGIFYTDYNIKKGQILHGEFVFIDPLTKFFVYDGANSTTKTLVANIAVNFRYDISEGGLIIEAEEN